MDSGHAMPSHDVAVAVRCLRESSQIRQSLGDITEGLSPLVMTPWKRHSLSNDVIGQGTFSSEGITGRRRVPVMMLWKGGLMSSEDTLGEACSPVTCPSKMALSVATIL